MSFITSSAFRTVTKGRPTRIYRHPIGALIRNALFVGFWGSLIYGLLLQLPVRLMFESLIASTPSLTDSHARIAYGVILLLPFAGLFLTMMLMRQRWTPRNITEQFTAIIGLSLVFGMVFNILISGSAFSLVATRDMWSFFHVMPDTASTEFREFIATAVYQVVTEAGSLSLLHMGLTLLGGIAIGLIVMPIASRKQAPDDTCNAFLPILAVVLPITLVVIFTVNVVIYAMLAPSTANVFTDDTRRTLAEVLIPLIQSSPILIGLLLVQAGLLVALMRTHVLAIHRRATRMAQVVYGIGFAFGHVWFANVAIPGFASNDPGRAIILLSFILAIAWAVVAQVKLHRMRKVQFRQRIELSFGRYMVMVVAVAMILWLCIDLFVLRTALNLVNIVVASIPSQTNHVTLSSLDAILNTAIHGGSVTSLVLLVCTITITCALFLPIVSVFRLLERWKKTI